ncbi:MAG: nucleotidyltransferase family protein [Terriglobales bacterium]
MLAEFRACPVARSWGDRLANKWNFKVVGLPELVEIHVQFLGQTGEHEKMARRVIERRTAKAVGGRQFYVPAPEERLVISTLQRVYRHFYFRLCDMIDVASLLRTETVDFNELRRAADLAGIWPGVATFLCLIRSYLEAYGGSMALPQAVMASASRAATGLQFKGGFLRMSKLSAAGFYGAQCLQAGVHRDLRALVRLPLLPPLAVSALVAYHLTGSDKGLW